ncbi:MAG: flippase-like domain-containing protein [bacterium]|nr:flippase-like domain-containing protein [bacterium]
MKKIITQIVLPVIILVAIIYFFFNDVSLTDIKENFLKIPFSYLVAFALLTIVGTVVRAYKYHILLSRKLRFNDLFLITLVRNFSVDLLPGRAAALFFYSWLTKKKGIKLEEGASSFVVSMFYDALALAFMLGGLLFFLDTGVKVNRWFIYIIMAVIFVISVVMIFFADTIIGWVLKGNLVSPFPKIEGILKNIREYLLQHKSNRERLEVFLLSLATRLVKYVFVYILFEGVVQIGFSLNYFSLFCFGLAGTELSALIPIQGPGGFGTWELAFTVIFQALNVPAENIKEAGFVIHITTQVWEYTIGLAALGYLYMSNPRMKPINANRNESKEGRNQ